MKGGYWFPLSWRAMLSTLSAWLLYFVKSVFITPLCACWHYCSILQIKYLITGNHREMYKLNETDRDTLQIDTYAWKHLNCLTTVTLFVQIVTRLARGLCCFCCCCFKHLKFISSVSYRFLLQGLRFPLSDFWLRFQSFWSPKALFDTNLY